MFRLHPSIFLQVYYLHQNFKTNPKTSLPPRPKDNGSLCYHRPILPNQGATPPPIRTGWGYPSSKSGLDVVNPPPSRLDGGTPIRTGWGTPPPGGGDRAAERALATRRAVCLLRSCRKTFLFLKCNHIFNASVRFFKVKTSRQRSCD